MTRTPLEYLMYCMEEYIEFTIKPAYRKPLGLTTHHILIFTENHKYKVYQLAQAELAPVMIAALTEELAGTSQDIVGFIIIADGVQLASAAEIEVGARISQHPDKERVCKILLQFEEGTFTRFYKIESVEGGFDLGDSNDHWLRPEEKLHGFHNPFYIRENAAKLPVSEVQAALGDVKKILIDFEPQHWKQ